jgi:uncharacterized membrane protein (UPF0127 family)
MNAATKQTLIPKLEVASTFFTRAKGLLGRDSMNESEALWISPCNNIHTFFMRFAIDLIFLNRDLVVTKTVPNVTPGRLVFASWKTASVIELKAGFLEKNPVQVGDRLHVDTALS